MNQRHVKTKCIWLTVCLPFSLLTSIFWLVTGVLAQNEGVIQYEGVKPFYLIGSPVPVGVRTQNISGKDGFLGLNYLGLPSEVRMVLVSPNGSVQDARPRSALYNNGSLEDPGIMPSSELYPFKAGEKVSLSYDLDELFDLHDPGKYKAQLTWGKTVLAETEVLLLSTGIIEKQAIEGRCYILPRLSVTPTGPGYQEHPTTNEVVMRGNESVFAFIQCNLIMSKAVLNGKEWWFLNIEGNQIGKRKATNLFDPLSVPIDTKVQKAELDFKGQLWITLEANGKHSLIIWNLLTGSAQSVISWQGALIEMGSTPRTNGSTGNRIVIAGIVGKTKISTLSYGVAVQVKQ